MKVVIREIRTPLTAFDLYSLFKDEDIIFLDSAKNPDNLGRFSFIGLNPFKKVTYSKGVVKEDDHVVEGDLFCHLKALLHQYKVENTSKLPFVGGCMGYMSYDLARDFEKLPTLTKSIVDIPDLYLVFYQNVIVIDHHHHQVYITSLMARMFESDQLDVIERTILAGKPNLVGPLEKYLCALKPTFTKEGYMDAVEELRHYIKSGDVYIANMTQTFQGVTAQEGFAIYKRLRHLNPAPFAAYLPLKGFEVISSSPERFIQVHNNKVTTRPIKGTVPRGVTAEEDEGNINRLKQSEKDKSELLMVVDLERNDLSKICEPHTVKVTELFEIETYATVHHLVATIEGQLKTDQTAVDCMRQTFPGGSITGTPKIRAMELIETLEKTRRNIYTGCIGYFGFDGGADFNIVIRTILKKENQVYVGLGGGVTWESNPEAEYQEILDKGHALFQALQTKEVVV